MIANKTIFLLAIIFLLYTATFALPIRKVGRPGPTSFSPRKLKPTETIKIYRTMRQMVIYFWGKNKFQNFQKQFSRHAVKYGSYYVLLYNLVYLAFFVKSYFQDKQHKEQKVSEIMSTYQSRMELTQSGQLQEEQVNRVISFLQDNLWIMQKRKYSSLQIFTTEISIIKVIYSQKCKYKILMCGVDSLGISDLCGVLTINKERMQLKLIKQYEDYISFFTNQQWRNVIYEGQSGSDFCWQGIWYTLDDQSDPNHSGQWILRTKFDRLAIRQQLCLQYY